MGTGLTQQEHPIWALYDWYASISKTIRETYFPHLENFNDTNSVLNPVEGDAYITTQDYNACLFFVCTNKDHFRASVQKIMHMTEVYRAPFEAWAAEAGYQQPEIIINPLTNELIFSVKLKAVDQ